MRPGKAMLWAVACFLTLAASPPVAPADDGAHRVTVVTQPWLLAGASLRPPPGDREAPAASGRNDVLPASSQLPAARAASKAEASADGKLDLSPWRGRVVLLDFWASWCGPCRESFPWMAEMVRKYKDQGLVVVTVNLDPDREAADGFLGGRRFDFEYLYDPEGRLAEGHAIEAMPTSILFNREGKEVLRHAGFRQEETAKYEAHIEALVATPAGNASGDGAAGEGNETASKRRIGARPWERGYLACAAMRFDSEPLDMAFDDHIYFSREASSGGRGFGGGGCGCN